VAGAGVVCARQALGADSNKSGCSWVSGDEVLQPLWFERSVPRKLVGLLSLMMVSVPSRLELHASIVAGLNRRRPCRCPRAAWSALCRRGIHHHADAGICAHDRTECGSSRPAEAGRFAGIGTRDQYLVMTFLVFKSTTAIFFSSSTSTYNFPCRHFGPAPSRRRYQSRRPPNRPWDKSS